LKIKGRGSEFAKWLQLLVESHADFKPRKVRGDIDEPIRLN
jgi:hypothetical protein